MAQALFSKQSGTRSIVQTQMRLHPKAPAIYSWDAQLTYEQLDERSGCPQHSNHGYNGPGTLFKAKRHKVARDDPLLHKEPGTERLLLQATISFTR
jgi:hypothetical protein